MTFTKTSTDEQRFMAKVAKDAEAGCWHWTAYKNPRGYGQFGTGSRTDGTASVGPAHRWAYVHWVGPIAAGLTIDHLCRSRDCVNPDHLEPVTQGVNTHRGRTFQAENAAKTHCQRGHEFTPENTLSSNNGHGPSRVCRQCKRERERRNRERRRTEHLGDGG